jgi:hypothetical protein
MVQAHEQQLDRWVTSPLPTHLRGEVCHNHLVWFLWYSHGFLHTIRGALGHSHGAYQADVLIHLPVPVQRLLAVRTQKTPQRVPATIARLRERFRLVPPV